MASAEDKVKLLLATRDTEGIFESDLDSDYITGKYGLSQQDKGFAEATWNNALTEIYGGNAIFVSQPQNADYVARKGYNPVMCGPMLKAIALSSKLKTELDVLNSMEQRGRVILPPSEEMVAVMDFWWDLICEANMHCNRWQPQVAGFSEPMDAGAQTLGQSDYDKGVIYLHVGLGGDILKETVLEELAHHITGATDSSRDLQDWIFRFATWLAQRQNG
jgi:hypothetical protein